MKKTRKITEARTMQTASDLIQNGVIINTENELTADDFYKALIQALFKKEGEIKVIVNRDGKSHFSVIPTISIHEQLTDACTQFCKEFNKQLTADIDAKERSGNRS